MYVGVELRLGHLNRFCVSVMGRVRNGKMTTKNPVNMPYPEPSPKRCWENCPCSGMITGAPAGKPPCIRDDAYLNGSIIESQSKRDFSGTVPFCENPLTCTMFSLQGWG